MITPKKLKQFENPTPTHLIYKTSNSLIIQNFKTFNQLEINFANLSFQLAQNKPEPVSNTITTYGILGLFTIQLQSYLIYITKTTYCCTINNCPIYKIDSINLINLSSDEPNQLQNNILSQLQQLFDNNFYYCPENYDLTLRYTLQYQLSNINYWYNMEWSKLFYMNIINLKNEFIFSIIHGYVGEFFYTVDNIEIRVVMIVRKSSKENECNFCEIELFIFGLPYHEVFNYVIYSCINNKDNIDSIIESINELFIKQNKYALLEMFFIERNDNNNIIEVIDKLVSKDNTVSQNKSISVISKTKEEFISSINNNKNYINLIHYNQNQLLYNINTNTFIEPEYQLGYMIIINNDINTSSYYLREIINYVVSNYFSKLNNPHFISSFKTQFSSLITDMNAFHFINYFHIMKLLLNNPNEKTMNELSTSNILSDDNLTIYTVTWNVQGLQIDNYINVDISQIIYPPQLNPLINKNKSPDIIVLGLQEIIEIKAKSYIFQRTKTKTERTNNWQVVLESFLFDDYVLLFSENLVGISLFCFIKKGKEINVKNVTHQKMKTGFKGVFGNKGYCILSFYYKSKSFAFVNGHFISGESNDKNEARVKEIKNLLTKELNKDTLVVHEHDYFFIMGDFNFRVELTPEQCNELISKREINKILEKDQFNLSKKNFDFKEGEICFLPTYKIGSNINEYNLNKTPSYCDRIFYSGKQCTKIKQIAYSSINYSFNSDHLPVCSLFNVTII